MDEVNEPFSKSPEFYEACVKIRKLFQSSFKACVDKVKAIDQDEQAWLDMINAPVVLPNKTNNTFFTYGHYTSRFREVLRDAQSYLVGAGPDWARYLYL